MMLYPDRNPAVDDRGRHEPVYQRPGYSSIGMLSVAIGAGTNLVLDPLFIFALGLGVRGAAIATVISQCLSAAFVVFLTKNPS